MPDIDTAHANARQFADCADAAAARAHTAADTASAARANNANEEDGAFWAAEESRAGAEAADAALGEAEGWYAAIRWIAVALGHDPAAPADPVLAGSLIQAARAIVRARSASRRACEAADLDYCALQEARRTAS